MAAVNLDRALLRFEFMQCLVRIAIAKYVHGGEGRSRSAKIADVSEALETLLTKDIAPNLPPEANVVPDNFRRGRLYTRPTHEALEKAEPMLRAIYDFYAATGDDQDVVDERPKVKGAQIYARALNLSLEEWFSLLDDARLLDDDFTRRSAVLCFVWSQPFVTDEIKRREKMQHLSYVDFLEAMCRILSFKPLPTSELLKQHSSRSCAHFFVQEEQGVHEGRKLLRRPFDWREERLEGSTNGGATLRPPLEMLISLLFERLSTTGDLLTRSELKNRLAKRAEEKREAAEEARRALEEANTPRLFDGITDILGGATKRAEMS